MSDSIVVDPQSPSPATSPEAAPQQQAPADLLASMIVPKDLEGIDPTYAGKSVRDIIEMQTNATKKIGEQANEIGVWRKLVADLQPTQAQHASAQEPTHSSEPVEITNEQLLDNPTEAISKVVKAAISDALAPIEDGLRTQSANTAWSDLQRDFPSFVETGNDPKFQEWVAGASSRQADAAAVQQGDAVAARRLLENFRDYQAVLATATPAAEGGDTTAAPTGESTPTSGVAAAQAAVTETGGQGGAPTTPAMKASDIVDMIINDPEKYRSESFQKELQEAAKAGRIAL